METDGITNGSAANGQLCFNIESNQPIGRRMTANRPIREGELIMTEKPLFAHQFYYNTACGYRACHQCLKPLETLEENLVRLTKKHMAFPYPECAVTGIEPVIPCEGCGICYCSVACAGEAWKFHHSILCTGNNKESGECLELLGQAWCSMHYPPECFTIFAVVRLLAMMKAGNDEERAAILKGLQDVCPTASREADEQMLLQMFGNNFKERLNILLNCLTSMKFLYHETTLPWLRDDVSFGSFLTAIVRKGRRITTSPISAWVKNVRQSGVLKSQDSENNFAIFMDDLWDAVEAETGVQFANTEGFGIYPGASAICHSCQPNGDVDFRSNDHSLSIVANRDISQGEEITIAYIGECNLERSRHSRRKLLLEDYRIDCNCERCDGEKDQPDMTSSEEEFEDEELGDDAVENGIPSANMSPMT